MFYSQTLLSRKGPLGAIWVAAYFHKRLKKHHVAETDISYSVDKILLDEVPVVTYRVLGYLLLGVVRIYSKKVEYLCDDCHEILIKIKDFSGIKKVTPQTEAMCAPYSSITLPDRFELDAFDLDVMGDISGGHVSPPEEIMLKEGQEYEGVGDVSLQKYYTEENVSHKETFACSYYPAEDDLVPQPMDVVMGRSPNANQSDPEARVEKPSEDRFSHEEHLDFEIFSQAAEATPDFFTFPGEINHVDNEQMKCQQKEVLENEREVFTEHMPNPTPESKFPDPLGAPTPEFMIIPTPAIMETARLSRKRKCFFDEMIVLPNEVLRRRIHNSTDLVSKRRKAPLTALGAWKLQQICSLSQGFFTSSIPCISSELQSLFCNKKLKDTEPVEVAESPKTQTVDRTVIDPGTGEPTTQTVDAPVIASEIAESPKTLTFDTPVITPDTPCDFPTSVGSETGPKVADTDDVGPASDYGKVASPIEDQELDLTLISEDMHPNEEHYKEFYGWSMRTWKVASFLHKSFLNRERLGKEKVIKLLEVLQGKTRKGSAKLFYEILVLKTEGYVDLDQDEAYNDISIIATPKWKAAFCN